MKNGEEQPTSAPSSEEGQEESNEIIVDETGTRPIIKIAPRLGQEQKNIIQEASETDQKS